MGQYLETLQRPDNMTDQQYQQLWKKSHHFLVEMGTYLNVEKDKIYPLGKLLCDLSNRRRSSGNYTIKAATGDQKQHTIKFLADINGRECMRTSSNMSNLAKSVNDELEFDMRSLCT